MSRKELRTMLSPAVNEIIAHYEDWVWRLEAEKRDPLLTADARRRSRDNLRSYAAQNFKCLVAEIRHLRTGPYINEEGR